ncbi:ABC transporter permease [Candidatus Epulonipiscioides gigas]|nr:ABC transporter permease [Epulopiscium sp. SCG-C07WGA-EpuloA2]
MISEKKNWPITILLIICMIIFILIPLYMVVIIAIKDPSDMIHVLSFPKELRLQNFVDAWVKTDYPVKFINTAIITIITLIFTLPLNSFTAYAIVRSQDKSKFFKFIYYYFLSAMFIPFSVIMLPLVIQASNFNLDNIWGISFLYIIFGLPMNCFLYSGAIKNLPLSLEEAAMIDGASILKTFWSIVFPLLKPMSATVAILSFMWTWNDFTMPLVLLTEESQQTLQLAQYVFKSQFSVDYNLAFASYTMVLLPILIVYIFAQKYIIASVSAGSVKG